jgi:hypothetical protein
MSATIIIDLSEKEKEDFMKCSKERLISFSNSINKTVANFSSQDKDERDFAIMYAFVVLKIYIEINRNLDNDGFEMRLSCLDIE